MCNYIYIIKIEVCKLGMFNILFIFWKKIYLDVILFILEGLSLVVIEFWFNFVFFVFFMVIVMLVLVVYFML